MTVRERLNPAMIARSRLNLVTIGLDCPERSVRATNVPVTTGPARLNPETIGRAMLNHALTVRATIVLG
jgi:hypothetical protein